MVAAVALLGCGGTSAGTAGSGGTGPLAGGGGNSGVGRGGAGGAGGSTAVGTGGTPKASGGATGQSGGTSGSSSCQTPTVDSGIVGSWVFADSAASVIIAFTFGGDGSFKEDVIYVAASNSWQDTVTSGQYSASGNSVSIVPEQSSCDSPQAVANDTFSIANGTLSLCNPTTCVTFSENTCSPPAANLIVTTGCSMNGGSFMAHALGPVSPGDAGATGGTTGTSSTNVCQSPNATSGIVGSWVFTDSAASVIIGFTFGADGSYTENVIYVASANGWQNTVTTGQYTVSGDSVNIIPEQSSCDSPQASANDTFSITNGVLSLCSPTTCLTFQGNTCGPLGPNLIVTTGCSMNSGPFTAHPLGPIPAAGAGGGQAGGSAGAAGRNGTGGEGGHAGTAGAAGAAGAGNSGTGGRAGSGGQGGATGGGPLSSRRPTHRTLIAT